MWIGESGRPCEGLRLRGSGSRGAPAGGRRRIVWWNAMLLRGGHLRCKSRTGEARVFCTAGSPLPPPSQSAVFPLRRQRRAIA